MKTKKDKEKKIIRNPNVGNKSPSLKLNLLKQSTTTPSAKKMPTRHQTRREEFSITRQYHLAPDLIKPKNQNIHTQSSAKSPNYNKLTNFDSNNDHSKSKDSQVLLTNLRGPSNGLRYWNSSQNNIKTCGDSTSLRQLSCGSQADS